MITVLYDGKCGLCRKEINHYRKIAPDNIFDWQDITESADDLKKFMEREHQKWKLKIRTERNNMDVAHPSLLSGRRIH